MKNNIHIWLTAPTPGAVLLLAAVVLGGAMTGCSTTKRLAEGQTLYTGVKKIEIANSVQGAKVPPTVAAAITEPLSVKPNNPLVSPWIRTPLPIGLWAYNSLYTEKKRGFRAFMYRTFAKQPVVVERDVQPTARTGMVRDILDNHGYFGSQATFELHPRGNSRTARVGYKVDVAPPWFFETVQFPAPRDTLTRTLKEITMISNLRPGLQYHIDTLAREQLRIATALRQRGFYWFRPEYVEYKADTTRVRHGVDLQVEVSRTAPPAALVPYRVGDVSLRILSADGRGRADSVVVNGHKVWYQRPLKLRHSVIRRAMTLYKGQTATLSDINRMLDNLTRIGVFRYVNPEITPLYSLRPGDSLNVVVAAAMATPMEMTGEADIAYKSSSFIGPALSISFGHGNIFKGGEVLSLGLVGSYEWQTGNTSQAANSTTVNSYEVGLTTSLVFPRMLVPDFMGRKLAYGGKTSYSMGVNMMNRPKFFRMVKFNWTNTYDFRTSSTVTHSFTPFKMNYNKMLRTTADFDQTMAENPVIALSFADQFIPSAAYTYTYDKRFGHLRRDRITVQATLMSAGNAWAGLYSLFGQQGGGQNGARGPGSKRIFGDPFSQFFKETGELRLYKRVGVGQTFALRLFAGAGHAYGNSKVLPYTEQFYVGGANSIRAFTVRSIGPGSYHSAAAAQYGYFDQTGELKLEMNAEFRFHVAGRLHGALFLDAGNVWLLHDDPFRPGGRIGSSSVTSVSDDPAAEPVVQRGFFNSVATGTGVGARYDLSFLVVRLDLGIGIHLPYATSRRGYYNIPRFRDGLGLHLAIGYPF
jgi:outer membrane protein assembly factor BamA